MITFRQHFASSAPQNRDNLLHEIDNIVSALTDFRAALTADDGEKLSALLREGTQDKSRIDG